MRPQSAYQEALNAADLSRHYNSIANMYLDALTNGVGSNVDNAIAYSGANSLAKDGMNDVIDIINDGIKAVDAVIHSFGSNNKRTIPTLDHVKFATGTGRNPITNYYGNAK
ncbi:30S ribosomal protein S11 [Lactiplantibacillus plantarum]|nr:hypothetical protein [Lactiplantibacillus plantarum]OUT03906.1 30S ribosomal protein S11 [Lactiplantibacillus plantarum]